MLLGRYGYYAVLRNSLFSTVMFHFVFFLDTDIAFVVWNKPDNNNNNNITQKLLQVAVLGIVLLAIDN